MWNVRDHVVSNMKNVIGGGGIGGGDKDNGNNSSVNEIVLERAVNVCSYRVNAHGSDKMYDPVSWVLEVFDESAGVWEGVHHVHNFKGLLN